MSEKSSYNLLNRLRKRPRRRRVAQGPVPGAVPATIQPQSDAVDTHIQLLSYDQASCTQSELRSQPVSSLIQTGKVTWIDVQGLADHAAITALAEEFLLHPLVLEDILHPHQRAKSEYYAADYLVIIMHVPVSGPPFHAAQITMVLMADVVLTFQEQPTKIFASVQERILGSHGYIRQRGGDYLCYALIDALIDAYFPMIERYDVLIESLEDNLIDRPELDYIHDIHVLRRELLDIRRAVWPLRDMMSALLRNPDDCFQAHTLVFLRDCADHVYQLLDILESYREISSSLIELHLSNVNIRINEIMKVLTMITTVFLPVTFISGLYGMNFDRASPLNMPELGWHYGYLFALVLMVLSAVTMFIFFFRKGWLARKQDE